MDGHLSYRGIDEHGYRHLPVIHNSGFRVGSKTTNGIESYWSLLKKNGSFGKDFSFITIEQVNDAVLKT